MKLIKSMMILALLFVTFEGHASIGNAASLRAKTLQKRKINFQSLDPANENGIGRTAADCPFKTNVAMNTNTASTLYGKSTSSIGIGSSRQSQ